MNSGCYKCPAYGKCLVEYRGSACAAMRAFYGVDFDPKTNADRIRGMDDEELAEFLSHIEAYRTYGYYAAHGLDWLRQPAEEIHDGN